MRSEGCSRTVTGASPDRYGDVAFLIPEAKKSAMFAQHRRRLEFLELRPEGDLLSSLQIVHRGDTPGNKMRYLALVSTSARKKPRVSLEVVDRHLGNGPRCRGSRLVVEALGHLHYRRASSGDRCGGDLPGSRPCPDRRGLHGAWGAIDDEPGTIDAHRSGGSLSALVIWRWVHRGRGHRVHDFGHRGRARGGCGARLPALRIRDLGPGGYRSRGRSMATGVRDAVGWDAEHTRHLGRPRSRLPSMGAVRRTPSLEAPRRRSFPILL